jgi:asparagine synthase (glutamine-hydrolysing)
MTTFCGIFSLNGSDCGSDLKTMLASYADDDSANIHAAWSSEGIALGQITVPNTLESFKETLPLPDADNKVIVIGDIRLDNRVELCKQLRISSTAAVNYGDAFLIVLAYKAWGELLADHLKGDFAFVIWNGNQKKVICCTDHLGSRNIFYFFNGRKFIFASTPNPILQLNEVPKTINFNKLSTIVYAQAKHLFWSESWFNEIFPMPSASVMTITHDGIRKRKYWEPDATKEVYFGSEAEFEEAFQEVLFRAVGNRMRSNFPVTALLSGGLDSSAVVSVAAKILESQNRQLEVFSAVLPDGSDPSLTDERFYIDQFKSFPNVKINYIMAPGKGFFSDLEKFQNKIYTPNLISRHYLYAAFADAARQSGSRVLLDGGGGEMSVSFYGAGGYAELFKKLKWQTLLHELKCQKALTGEPLLQNIYSNVVRPLVSLKTFKRVTTGALYLNEKNEHCLQASMEEKLKAQWEPRKQELNNLTPEISSSHRVNLANYIRRVQIKGHGKADFGTVEPRFPLLDKDVLEFCLAAPLKFKIRNGYKRYTVRAGLNGLLPPEIQWRTSKGPFSPDYRLRYQAQLPEVRSFLDGIALGDPVRQIVDVEKIKAWTSPAIGPGDLPEKIIRDVVPDGIYLIHFLRRFPEYR